MSAYLMIFGKPRYMGLAKIDDEKILTDERPSWVLLKTFRGFELGLPSGKLTDEQYENYCVDKSRFEEGSEAIFQQVEFVRKATDKDIELYYVNKNIEEEALLKARSVLVRNQLDMKIADAEFTLDRKKIYFYFTADQRIDFRLFVRELAHAFRARIELRQIGIRDEARIVKGIASCGRPCCCSYWLRSFSPISMKIVKEQRSALNPTKISGLCGRLMCCMSYEKDYYSEVWSKLPGPGAKIKTPQGVYTLETIELGNESVNIRFPNGRLVQVSIKDFPTFQETVLNGEEWGEDKELAEKKKAAAERMAMLKAKAERRKLNVKVNAKPFKPLSDKIEKILEGPKAKVKNKPKQNKSQNRDKQSKQKYKH